MIQLCSTRETGKKAFWKAGRGFKAFCLIEDDFLNDRLSLLVDFTVVCSHYDQNLKKDKTLSIYFSETLDNPQANYFNNSSRCSHE